MFCRYGSLFALTALALLPGCAALINGPTQDIVVNSDPPGAQCTMMREKAVIATVPQTPAVVRVNRSAADIVVDCRREGHGQGRHRMKSSADGMTLGNIVGAGLMGMGIDSATNADKAYETAVTVAMSPQAVPDPAIAAEEPQRLAQASPVAIGTVAQASWVAQRAAAANASNQVPTAPVGYAPPPEKQPEKPLDIKPVQGKPDQSKSAGPKPADTRPAESRPVAAAAPKAAAPKPEPPKAVATMKAPSPATGSGLWRAHLASHRTEGAAIAEWQELLKKDPKLYGEFDPSIAWIDVKDRGSFARLLVGGWAERKEADAACAKIRGPRRYCAAIKD